MTSSSRNVFSETSFRAAADYSVCNRTRGTGTLIAVARSIYGSELKSDLDIIKMYVWIEFPDNNNFNLL
jgi:hypothetical protein